MIYLFALISFAIIYLLKSGWDLIVSPILGFMIGVLYDREEQEDYVQHTVQILIGVVSFTFIKYEPFN